MQKPIETFEVDVRPACEAYLTDSTSEWKAKAAAQAINNFAEWVFYYYQDQEPSRLLGTTNAFAFRLHHAKACPQFQIVWDLADAAKHRRLTRKSFRIVETATDAWTSNDETLVIKSTGDEVDVLIGMAMDYWKNQISN